MNYDDVRQIALTLPGVAEGTSYGTPALFVKKKLILRLREDEETLVAAIDWDERESLLQAHPDTLFLTDHYRPYPWVLIRLPIVSREELTERILDAWKLKAPKSLLAGDVRQK